MARNTTKDLTKGPIMKNIIKFCLPLMVGNLFQQFYNMADIIIVGKCIDQNALSAVGSVGSLNFLVVGSVIGLCTGFTVPVAKCFGAQDEKGLKKYVSNIIYVSLTLAVIITIVAVSFTEPLLRLLRTPETIYDNAYKYIIIIFAGIGATMLYNILASLVRALGDSKTPLYFLVFSSILNIGLDILFVNIMEDVRGAAIATVFSQLVSGVLCLLYIKKRFPVLKPTKETMGFDFKYAKELIRNGIPLALQFSITAIGSVMLQSCVNGLGDDIIAAVTIGGKTQLMITLPSETIGATMTVFCGQNLGAGKIDRIKKGVKRGVVLVACYTVIGFLIAQFLGPYISLLFVNSDGTKDVIILAQQYINAGSYFYFILSALFLFRNSIQGLGYSSVAMFAGIFELVARAIMGFGFVETMGYNAACVANPVAWIAADVFLIPAYIFIINKIQREYNGKKLNK